MIALLIASIENDSDREFLESLYNTYNRLMLSEIRKIVKESCDAEDILHTVIIKLINRVALLRTLSRNKLVNYIIVASRNTTLNHLRAQARRSSESIDNLPDDFDSEGFDPVDKVTYAETLENFREAYLRLDEKNRTLLDMKYTLEKNDDEIAAALGIKTDSVRMALTRARGKAKALIKETEQA